MEDVLELGEDGRVECDVLWVVQLWWGPGWSPDQVRGEADLWVVFQPRGAGPHDPWFQPTIR